MARSRIATLVLVCAALACSGRTQPPASPAEVRAVNVEKLPSAPDDPAWARAPLHTAALLPQDVVEPRLLAPTTAAVEVQAVTDGRSIAFRLSWAAPERRDLPGPGMFGDACAVQLLAGAPATVPSPMMGEVGQPVEITYWRAAWQAAVDGRPDTLAALYPQAKVDHYPFDSASLKAGSPEQVEMARRYAPARALGNPMAGPRESPVQDLVASGPGTIAPAAKTISSGSGKPTATGWAVTIVRPLPNAVRPGARSVVAFAVWQGAKGEAGARKMRSGWIPLSVEAAR